MYYLKRENKILGPFTLERLQHMVVKGKLLPRHHISEDKSLWVKAEDIKELFPDLANFADTTVEDEGMCEGADNVELEIDMQSDELLSVVAEVNSKDGLIQEKNVLVSNYLGSNQKKADGIKLLSLLWNPVYAFPLLLEEYTVTELKLNSFLLAFASFVCFAGTMIISIQNYTSLPILLLTAALPFCLLTCFTFAFVKLFSGGGTHHLLFFKTLFLSAAVLMPFSLSSIFFAFLYMTGKCSIEQIIVVVAGLGVYALSYAVLLIFNALTKVFEIDGGGTVFIVSSLLLLTLGITAFFIRLL